MSDFAPVHGVLASIDDPDNNYEYEWDDEEEDDGFDLGKLTSVLSQVNQEYEEQYAPQQSSVPVYRRAPVAKKPHRPMKLAPAKKSRHKRSKSFSRGPAKKGPRKFVLKKTLKKRNKNPPRKGGGKGVKRAPRKGAAAKRGGGGGGGGTTPAKRGRAHRRSLSVGSGKPLNLRELQQRAPQSPRKPLPKPTPKSSSPVSSPPQRRVIPPSRGFKLPGVVDRDSSRRDNYEDEPQLDYDYEAPAEQAPVPVPKKSSPQSLGVPILSFQKSPETSPASSPPARGLAGLLQRATSPRSVSTPSPELSKMFPADIQQCLADPMWKGKLTDYALSKGGNSSLIVFWSMVSEFSHAALNNNSAVEKALASRIYTEYLCDGSPSGPYIGIPDSIRRPLISFYLEWGPSHLDPTFFDEAQMAAQTKIDKLWFSGFKRAHEKSVKSGKPLSFSPRKSPRFGKKEQRASKVIIGQPLNVATSAEMYVVSLGDASEQQGFRGSGGGGGGGGSSRTSAPDIASSPVSRRKPPMSRGSAPSSPGQRVSPRRVPPKKKPPAKKPPPKKKPPRGGPPSKKPLKKPPAGGPPSKKPQVPRGGPPPQKPKPRTSQSKPSTVSLSTLSTTLNRASGRSSADLDDITSVMNPYCKMDWNDLNASNTQDLKVIKVLFMGDEEVGKTQLAKCMLGAEFEYDYIPTVFEVYKVAVPVFKQQNVELWDLSGDPKYDRKRPVCYPNVHCFVVCFDVTDRLSWESCKRKYIREALGYPKNPLLVVGCRMDQMSGANAHECIKGSEVKGYLESHAHPFKCWRYFTTSAYNGIGLHDLFQAIIYTSLYKVAAVAQPNEVRAAIQMFK